MNAIMDRLDEVRETIEMLNANARGCSDISLYASLVGMEATLLQRVKNGIRHF